MTDRTAVGWECKKHFMRQISDGWVVSFVVHTDDSIPEWFTNARVGTPMDVAVELKDHDKDMQSPPDVDQDSLPTHEDVCGILKPYAPAPEDKPKREREWTLSQQCFQKCRSPEFWKFLRWQFKTVVAKEDVAAWLVREWCCVQSRSELDADEDAAARWENLLDIYETDYRHAPNLAREQA